MEPLLAEQTNTSHRPIRSRLQKAVYKDLSSEEEATLGEESSPVTIYHGIHIQDTISADPRRAGRVEGVESLILTVSEIRTLLEKQTAMEDQRIWMTNGISDDIVGR